MGSNCSFSLGNLELERGELLFPLLFMVCMLAACAFAPNSARARLLSAPVIIASSLLMVAEPLAEELLGTHDGTLLALEGLLVGAPSGLVFAAWGRALGGFEIEQSVPCALYRVRARRCRLLPFWVRRPFPPKPSSSSASYRSYRSRFCLRSSESVPLCPNQKVRRSNPTSRRRIASQDAFFWGRCSSVWRQGSCRRTDPILEWMRRRRFPSRSCSSSCSALPRYSSSEARGQARSEGRAPPRRRDARRYLARCRLRPGR